MKAVGVGVAATVVHRLAMAGPFDASESQNLVPEDKKLSADWVKSLFARGDRTIYRGDELKYIGMPIGGLCAGQLYFGGDGKLWHWDIFNIQAHTNDAHYAHPVAAASPVDQGFRLRARANGRMLERTLDRIGFPSSACRGEEMAKEIGDAEFAKQFRAILDVGPANLIKRAFDGGYFLQIPIQSIETPSAPTTAAKSIRFLAKAGRIAAR